MSVPIALTGNTCEVLYELVNCNTEISYGACVQDGVKFFYKRIPQETIQREIVGHAVVSGKYPTTRLYGVASCGFGRVRQDVLLYEYLDELDKKGAMLSDILDMPYDKGRHVRITDMYAYAYNQTLIQATAHVHDVFFRDRIKSRIQPWYTPELLKKWDRREVIINDETVVVRLPEMISSLEAYFSKRASPEWCVLSQGDPTEWNIATAPLILDYEAGGYVPLAAELAVTIAMTSHYGDFLARKYNPAYFKRRGLLDMINTPMSVGHYAYRRFAHPCRREFLVNFVETVYQPLLSKDKFTNQFKDAYRHYYLMKMLAVFSPATLSEDDFAYVVAKSQQVFDSTLSATSLTDIIETSIA